MTPLPENLVLAYAHHGWPVHPLHSMRQGACSCGKSNDAPNHSPGKHPRTPNGLKDATTDPAQIQAWLAEWPDANWGISTGPAGLLVVDIDVHKGGGETWKALTTNRNFAELETIRAKTGGGGLHFLFLNPKDKPLSNSTELLGKGIDTRGLGGYIVAAPGNHKSGGTYEWIKGHAPGDHKILPLPAWIDELLRSKRGTGTLVPGDIGDRIPRGRRDSSLLSLAGSMRGRGVPQSAIEAALLGVNARLCDPPLDPSSVLDVARRYKASDQDADRIAFLAGGENDAANADRFLQLHAHCLRFVHEWGWMVWDGRLWQRDTHGLVDTYAIKTARLLETAAQGIQDEERRKTLLRWARSSQNANRLAAMTKLASSHPSIRKSVKDFDTHDALLNVRNGVLELTAGQLLQHDPELYLTHLVDIEYDATAKCPIFENFLEWCCMKKTGLIEYLQRAAGYTLTGFAHDEALFFLYGAGSNGKSTFLNILSDILGDLSFSLGTDALLMDKGSRNENILVSGVGKRMALAVEAAGGRLNEDFAKHITGGDAKARARHMYQDGFDYQIKFKTWIGANDKPSIRGNDEAIWSRLKLIPFRNHMPRDSPKKLQIRDLVRAEHAGVLAWMVRGAMEWRNGGLRPPPEVVQAIEEYRSDQDIFAQFVDEHCTIADDLEVSAGELLGAINIWREGHGEKSLSATAVGNLARKFRAEILQRGKDKHGRIIWRGLGLRNQAPSPGGQINLAQADRIEVVHAIVRQLHRMHKGPVPEEAILQECAADDRPVSREEALRCLAMLLHNGTLMEPHGRGSYAPKTTSNADGLVLAP